MSIPPVVVSVVARDEATKVLHSVGANIRGFATSAAKSLGLASLAPVGLAAAGIKMAGDLEQAVANIKSIKPEIDTSAMFASLNEMQTRIPQDAKQLADAVYNIFSSIDIDVPGATKLAEQFAKGATAAQTDAETFGTSILGVMNAYSLGVEEATHVSDVFFNTVKLGVVTGAELATSLGPVTQLAKNAGVSFDELGGMIAGVTKEGGPAAQNINNLANFLNKITSEKAKEALGGLGIATVTSTGQIRPVLDVLTDLKASLGGMTEAAKAAAIAEIFPDVQARLGANVLLSQLDFVKGAVLENAGAAGIAEAAFQTMAGTFNSQLKILQNSFSALLTNVGGKLLPMLTPFVMWLSKEMPGAVDRAGASLAQFGASIAGISVAGTPLLQFLQDVGGTLAAVFGSGWAPDAAINPVVNAIGGLAITFRDVVIPAAMQVATWLGENVPTALSQLGTAMAELGAITGPIFTDLAAGVGSVAAIFSDQLGPAADGSSQGVNVLKLAFDGLLLAVRVVAAPMITLAAVFKTIAGAVAAFSAAHTHAAAAIGQFFSDLGTGAQGVLAALATLWEEAVTAVAGVGPALTAAAADAWTGIQTGVSDALTAVSGVLSEGWAAAVAVVTGFLTEMHAAVTDVWNQIPADIREDLELIGAELSRRFALFLQDVANGWQAILDATAAKWAEITTAVGTAVAEVGAAITAKWAEITGATEATWSAISGTVGQWLATVVAAVTGWVILILGHFTGFGVSAREKADGVGRSIFDPIKERIDAVLTAIGTWIGEVLGALGGMVGKVIAEAQRVGQGIVDGITGAIQGAGDRVSGAVLGIVRNALQSAKDALGIKSPSTLFATQVGLPIAEGIIVGMKSGAKLLDAAVATVGGDLYESFKKHMPPLIVGASGAAEKGGPLSKLGDAVAGPIDALAGGVAKVVSAVTGFASQVDISGTLAAKLGEVVTAVTERAVGLGEIVSGAGDAVSRLAASLDEAAERIGDIEFKLPDIEGFAKGGIVGGPEGRGRLILAHGGERVQTPAQQRIEQATINVYGVGMNEVAGEIERRMQRRQLIARLSGA